MPKTGNKTKDLNRFAWGYNAIKKALLEPIKKARNSFKDGPIVTSLEPIALS